MKHLILTVIVYSLSILPAVGEAATTAGHLAIAFPPDRSFVESGIINVVLQGGASTFDGVQISVNDRKQAVPSKPISRYYLCYDGIRLSYGLNKIRVTGFKDGRKTEEATAQVFYRSDLSPSSSSAPPAFRKYLFHGDAGEKVCSPCHELNFTKSGQAKDGPDRSPCYMCHKKILSNYRFVHGPAAVWSCLTCHDGKSTNSKLSVIKPDDKSCADCHETSWGNKNFKHGPTAAGNCTTCHDPHAADKPFFLRMDTGDLCASCHEDVLYRPHVLTTFSGGGGHPLRRSPDPFNPLKDFTCASCHNPHGSNSSVFLNAYEDSGTMHSFCRSCHKM
ncbi:MAG: hypothetical protein NDI77_01665 [Geobacteraceae bacterium]|nr:hypothetical protein [Geobacteraceae bacterium]